MEAKLSAQHEDLDAKDNEIAQLKEDFVAHNEQAEAIKVPLPIQS